MATATTPSWHLPDVYPALFFLTSLTHYRGRWTNWTKKQTNARSKCHSLLVLEQLLSRVTQSTTLLLYHQTRLIIRRTLLEDISWVSLRYSRGRHYKIQYLQHDDYYESQLVSIWFERRSLFWKWISELFTTFDALWRIWIDSDTFGLPSNTVLSSSSPFFFFLLFLLFTFSLHSCWQHPQQHSQATTHKTQVVLHI